MHRCPVAGCTVSIGRTKLICLAHWRMVDSAMRRNLVGAYRRLQLVAGMRGYEADAAQRWYRELRRKVIDLATAEAARLEKEARMKAWVFNEEMLEKALAAWESGAIASGATREEVQSITFRIRSFLDSPAAIEAKMTMGAKP